MNVIVAGLLLAVAEPPADPTKQTPEQMLQGAWKLVSVQRGGKDLPAKRAEGMRLLVSGKTFTLKDGQRDEVVTFKVDATKKPLAIDLMPDKARDKPVLGIFLVEGVTLKLCWSKGGPRPTEFTTKQGSDEVLFVLRREKK